MLALSGFAASVAFASPVWAASCADTPHRLTAVSNLEVEYTPRERLPGHRIVLAGTSWELVRTQLMDATGTRSFSVTYPVRIAERAPTNTRDYFVTVDIDQSDADDCNDVAFQEDTPTLKLQLHDNYRSFIRRDAFGTRAERLESQRRLATEMHVRSEGVEITIATGFATRRELDLSPCVHQGEDSFGIVETEPGQVRVTCFPSDQSQEYVSNIAWNVDYQWPQDPSGLIDQLIDYVHVETLP